MSEKQPTIADVLHAITNFSTQVDTRFDRLEERMDRLEGRMDSLEGRMDSLEGRMDRQESISMRLLDVLSTKHIISAQEKLNIVHA